MIKLTAESGPSQGGVWILAEQEVSLGRGGQCHICIPDPALLPLHCVLHAKDTRLCIRCTAEGTVLAPDGSAVNQVTLDPGGAFEIGDSHLSVSAAGPVLHLAASAGATEQDPVTGTETGEGLMLLGKSRAMSHVRALAQRAAHSGLPVLIIGETGTGKELVARRIHAQSQRKNRPLIALNCAAIPRELFESEFFGYERGAFTGADRTKTGWLQQADGGTLFLDEIGELAPEHQSRLLRVLEGGTFYMVGGSAEHRVDVRIVAATNRDLQRDLASRRFRPDLYHRLCGFQIDIPPLRRRPSDIPLLAEHFLVSAGQEAGRQFLGFSPQAVETLRNYRWPGNVRELRNCVYRAVHTAEAQVLTPGDLALPSASALSENEPARALTLAEVERLHIAKVLEQCQGRVRETARVLGIARSTLYSKLNDVGLHPKS